MNRSLEQADLAEQRFSLKRLAISVFQTTTLLGVAALISGNVAVTAYVADRQEKALAAARINARNLNTAFDQFVSRTIKNIDQALLITRAEIERDPAAFSAEKLANRDYFPRDLALQLAIIGPNGMMRGSNLQSSGNVDLSDRDHYRVHTLNTDDTLYISRPVLGRVSQRWTLQFTRKLRDAEGRFGGVLVASVSPDQLTKIYDATDIGREGAMTVWGADGFMRARAGARAEAIGRGITSPGLASASAGAQEGVYQANSVVDGVERIVSFRRVADYPLMTTVALSRQEALRDLEADKVKIQRLLTLVDLALLAIIALGTIEKYRLNTARERLSSQARMLGSTFANMQEGILMIDQSEKVVTINDRALSLLGLRSDSIHLPLAYAALPLRKWELDGGVNPNQRLQEVLLADGRAIEVRTSSMPGGGSVKTLTDMTERKQNQIMLEDARDKAEAGSRARTAFLATMSHEIRTPLGGILSMVDLIGTTQLDQTQSRYVDMTRDSAEHLLRLIDDILDVTKLDAGQLKFETIPFDLHAQIRSALDIVTAKAQEKGLAIGCLLSVDTPREITGDPGRLRQVLLNLLGNAIKFTSRGHVLLDVSRRRDPDGDRLVVSIKDTGIGIAQESIGNLFSEFSQIDSSISRRFGGTGLGLSISRKLVRRMGGTIGVESTPGVGSTFHFELPITQFREPELPSHENAAVAIIAPLPFDRDLIQRQIEQIFTAVHAFDSLESAGIWIQSQPVGVRRILLLDSALADAAAIAQLAAIPAETFLLTSRQQLLASEQTDANFAGIVERPVFVDTILRDIADTVAREAKARPIRQPLAGTLDGLQVLLAEDNVTNQFALRRMLETMGAQVAAASNGLEAVKFASAKRYDVVLMDVMMPELDGLAATRAIRAMPAPFKGVPVIALTAGAFLEDREAAFAAGMNGFATKPITAQQLLEAIRACGPGLGRGLEMSPAPQEAPEMDRKVIAQLREDLGEEHIGMAISIFLKDLKARSMALAQAGDDSVLLRKEAHALKGSAASFGFMRLAATAGQLEAAARAGATELGPLAAALLAEAERVPTYLEVV